MKKFFKGYYYKHQKNNETVAFIVGKSNDGEFVQIITNDESYSVPFIAQNIFSEDGIGVDINYKNISVSGNIRYHNLHPIKYDIMGPFKFFPMECRHMIVSMKHDLEGSLLFNGKRIDFTGGRGYIEGDSGKSFPKNYNWIHCNDFDLNLSIMASVADIPFLGSFFKGCICVVHFNDKEYRLATYLGAKILEHSNERIVICQRNYRIEIDVLNHLSQKLSAPNLGCMSRTVYESVNCSARFKFYIEDKLIFDVLSNNASFE